MTEDSLHLDNQLCFLFTPALEGYSFYRPYLEEMGITYPSTLLYSYYGSKMD